MGSEDDMSVSTASDGSVASANTLFTFSTNASESLFKPTADKTLLETIADSTVGKKAVKADDAAVPVHLWNDRINTPTGAESTQGCLEGCRELELRVFRRALYLDCLDYLQATYGEDWQTLEQKKGQYRLTKLGKDTEAVRNILWHASETSFFEYHAGSRLHFFRWPDRYKKMARDGVPVMFERPGPSKKQRQPEFNDPAVKEQVRSKIMKVIKRRYMVRARTSFDIKSLIKYFAVPKGLSDIRIVYDATASGLNEVVWAPSFWLATIDSLVRALDSTSWMVDRDIGDMFLNFQLHESAWCYAGVDIKPGNDERGSIQKEGKVVPLGSKCDGIRSVSLQLHKDGPRCRGGHSRRQGRSYEPIPLEEGALESSRVGNLRSNHLLDLQGQRRWPGGLRVIYFCR
jgi:hypothetical protein